MSPSTLRTLGNYAISACRYWHVPYDQWDDVKQEAVLQYLEALLAYNPARDILHRGKEHVARYRANKYARKAAKAIAQNRTNYVTNSLGDR